MVNLTLARHQFARNSCKKPSVRPPKLDSAGSSPGRPSTSKAVIEAIPNRYRAMAGRGALRDAPGRDRSTKGGRTRAVPLPDWVAVELAEHLRRFPAKHDDLVFTSREHKPLNRNHIKAATYGDWLSLSPA